MYFLYGWAIGTPLTVLVFIIITLVVVYKLSGHCHALRVHCGIKSKLRLQQRRQRRISNPRAVYLNDAQDEAAEKNSNRDGQKRRLRVLSLNMFLRPWPIADDRNDDYKDVRLTGFLNEYCANFDILCLQECFSTMNVRKYRCVCIITIVGVYFVLTL